MNLLKSPILAAALVLGALSISPEAAVGDHTSAYQLPPHSELFPTPSSGLVIRAEDQTLETLLDEFARVTGEKIIYSTDTGSLLQGMRPNVRGDLEVAPEDVYAVVQNVMVTNRFVFTNLRREEPRMIAVASLDSPARASIKQDACFVPIERLDEYANDSAFLIQTVLELPNTDTPSVGAIMRQLVVDPNTMQIIPIREHQIILTGFANRIHDQVQLLRRIDEGAARGQERNRDLQMHEALLKAANRLGVAEEN